VLNKQEVAPLIAAARNITRQAALSVACGAELRASKECRLKACDFDSERMTRVHRAHHHRAVRSRTRS